MIDKKYNDITAFILSHLISSDLISSHLISSHLISSHLISSRLISSHLISSHLISSHLIWSHLISCQSSLGDDRKVILCAIYNTSSSLWLTSNKSDSSFSETRDKVWFFMWFSSQSLSQCDSFLSASSWSSSSAEVRCESSRAVRRLSAVWLFLSCNVATFCLIRLYSS